MISNLPIICFGGEDWWYHHPHSKNHIMRRLARAGNRVVFVNSISMGLPAVGSPDIIAKILRKLRSYAKICRRTEEGMIVVTPVVLPFYSRKLVRAINRRLLVVQMKLLMIAFDIVNPLLWIAIPTACDVAGQLGEIALIYQVSDKYESNRMDHAVPRNVIASMHQALLASADLVYYSGRKLYDEEACTCSPVRFKARLLEHAVDFEHFASATASVTPLPEEISSIPSPRLGYFGALDYWLMDQSLIRYIAQKRPEWHWVLIGLKAAPLEIEDLPNVHCLGPKPYSDLPSYAAAFDVCVLPWVTDNEFVSYLSAIKVREYLATGKPAVMTPLYEYRHLDGIVRIARDRDDFISQVEESLTRDNLRRKKERQEAVKQATWDARTLQVSRDIEQLLLSNGS